jgi:hypothetical protein
MYKSAYVLPPLMYPVTTRFSKPALPIAYSPFHIAPFPLSYSHFAFRPSPFALRTSPFALRISHSPPAANAS